MRVIAMKKLRIEIIEDDGLIALLLETLLEQMGHMVCATASTEAAAVDAAQRCEPDLLIADARLRSGSGISAVEEIFRTRGKIPYLFVSGDIADITARLPAAITLRKPFAEAALARAIDSALAARAIL
jgi:two-component system, response regulator PdtaR